MPQRRLLASSLAGLLALVGSPLLDRASVAQAQDEADCEEAACASVDADAESAAAAEEWDETAQGEEETADEEPSPEEGTGSEEEEEEESDGEEPADNGAVAENAEPTEPTTLAPEPTEPPAPAATPTPAVPTPAPAPQADATATRADLRNFIARKIEGHQFSDSDDLFALGLVNSLFAMQLVSFCESHFGIEVPGEKLEIDNFRSINAMVAMIESSQRR